MKKLLLLFVFGAFFITLLSFSVGISDAIVFNNKLKPEPQQEDCAECKAKLDSCMAEMDKPYIEAVERAADKLKSGEITRDEYELECGEAARISNASDTICTAAFNKCCLEMMINKKHKEKE